MRDDFAKDLVATIRKRIREKAEWWDTQQELLLLYGRRDPRIDPEFLKEWDATPPPLARVRWDPTHPDHSDYCDCLDEDKP